MTLQTLLRHLQQQQIRLWLAQPQLHYQAQNGQLDAATRRALQQHKASLIAWLEVTGKTCVDDRSFTLDATGRLHGVALTAQCQLETLLLAAFAVLLARYQHTTAVTIDAALEPREVRRLSLSWTAHDSFIEILQYTHATYLAAPPKLVASNEVTGVDAIFGLFATPADAPTRLLLHNSDGRWQGWWQSRAFNLPMPQHWQHLLWGIVQNPHQNAMRIPLFDLAERRLLLIEKNSSAAAHQDAAVDVVAAIQRQQGIAVMSATQQVSYAELHRQADHFAAQLPQQGLGAAVALRLDATAPAAMLALQQRGAACLFAQEGGRECNLPLNQVQSGFPLPTGEETACILASDTEIRFSARALVQFIASQPWTAPARTLVVAEAQIYWQLCLTTLACGGTWIHAPVATAAQLAEALQHFQVERAFVPTTLLLELAALNEAFLHLHEMIHLGAALPVTDSLREWLHDSGIRCYNLYHLPASLALCVYHAPPECRAWPDYLPIGTVLGGNAAYILDPYQQPVAVGMAGELYFSGPGIGRSAPTLARLQLALHRQQLVMMPEEQNPLLTETCQVMQASHSYQQARYRDDGLLDVLPPRLDSV